ncbi:Lsr2 family protein [Myceligenerans indicum]|uniref:Site-specific integrase n=1 Tax=Myceligenerans indicum TaxID=2593663 RepID=A0ABS1LL72_9MICO|nr:Lsr2 family protein [Myceligenerans indicum]MBL0886913.1 site-specific integrase [Myceligenerans indicum]
MSDSPTINPARRGDASTPQGVRAPRRTRRAAYGNIRETRPGRFQARYTGPDKKRRPVGTFDTYDAAAAALAKVLADVHRGTYREPETGEIALGEYAPRWLAIRELKDTTRSRYDDLLRRWILTPLDVPGTARQIDLSTYPLRSISHGVVSEWYAALKVATAKSAEEWLARGPGPSEAQHVRAWARQNGRPVKESGHMSTALWEAWRAAGSPPAAEAPEKSAAVTGRTQAARAYALLRTICGDAVRDRLLDANPCAIRGAGKTSPAERVIPAGSVVDMIAAACRGSSEGYRAAVIVSAWSGLRAGELFALRRQDVERTRSGGVRLRVRQALVDVTGKPLAFGPPKSDAGKRPVHLPPEAGQALLKHLDQFTGPSPQALVFTTSTGRPLRAAQRSAPRCSPEPRRARACRPRSGGTTCVTSPRPVPPKPARRWPS